MKDLFIYEEPVFWEDENAVSNKDAASEFFNIREFNMENLNGSFKTILNSQYLWRGPCSFLLGEEYSFDKWILNLNPYYINYDYNIIDLQTFIRNNNWHRLFVRPVSGKKPFGGETFTSKSLKVLTSYLDQQKNIQNLMVVTALPKQIEKEWRFVFVDQELIDGSQYMALGELSVAEGYPDEAKKIAQEIGLSLASENKFDFTVDIGYYRGGYKLIEINSFESSSFYACDLNRIYKALSNT